MQYLYPVPKEQQEKISQRFGENPAWYPSTNGHTGIDWGIPEGTPILAAADGVVTRAELDTATAASPHTGYGYHIRIQHADGTTSIYGHLCQGGILVKTGQRVRMGEVIGRSGNTGMSTGPHLHFEVRKGPEITSCFDPFPWLVKDIPPAGGLMIAELLPEGSLLTLRGSPIKGKAPMGSLKAGDQMRVLGLTGSDAWLQVEVTSGKLSGKSGYVMYQSAWLSLLRPND